MRNLKEFIIKEFYGYLSDPIEVVDGMYINDIKFDEMDRNHYVNGSVHLSLDATEDEPDGDAFATEFKIDTDRLNAYLNPSHKGDRYDVTDPEISDSVKLYQGVTYSKEAKTALSLNIIALYLNFDLCEMDVEDWIKREAKESLHFI